MTSDESRLAVLENKVDTLDCRHEELQGLMVKAIERLEAMVTRHDADLRILNEDRSDRKGLYKMIQAAFIGELIKPVIFGLLVWWWWANNK